MLFYFIFEKRNENVLMEIWYSSVARPLELKGKKVDEFAKLKRSPFCLTIDWKEPVLCSCHTCSFIVHLVVFCCHRRHTCFHWRYVDRKRIEDEMADCQNGREMAAPRTGSRLTAFTQSFSCWSSIIWRIKSASKSNCLRFIEKIKYKFQPSHRVASTNWCQLKNVFTTRLFVNNGTTARTRETTKKSNEKFTICNLNCSSPEICEFVFIFFKVHFWCNLSLNVIVRDNLRFTFFAQCDAIAHSDDGVLRFLRLPLKYSSY